MATDLSFSFLQAQLQTKYKITNTPEQQKETCKGNSINPVLCCCHVHLLKELHWAPEVAVCFWAGQLLTTIAIYRYHSSLEAISNVTNICHPLQIARYCVKVHKETRKQENWHWSYWSKKHSILKGKYCAVKLYFHRTGQEQSILKKLLFQENLNSAIFSWIH